ncbi:MAG TPA: HEAT repeat domain-containing protein [Terriglobales bacterium]|nr:HEAT repeat domain-containing protein [Terriglobales bacterium]
MNILIKYTRLYGFDHKRTEGQFDVCWNELQQGLPDTGSSGFLLGVSDSKLLLDGAPLEAGQADRSFATLLNTAGLASIHFSQRVTKEDFIKLVKAFTSGGSKGQDVASQVREALGDSSDGSIKINEVRFVAADPTTGEISIAAQIAAQTLGPEFKQWLSEPQKLLQLIAAAEGAQSGTGGGEGTHVPVGTVPYSAPGAKGGNGGGNGTGTGTGTGTWDGGTVALQEEEVIKAIRLLTRFGEVGTDPNASQETLQQELAQVDPNTRLNLQQLLGSLAAKVGAADQDETPLLMKAAEHMAIRFALERFQKGEVKVNAVHQMLEHMSRQMDTLRQILRIQEDKMGKAGILVESHADILDRLFWAEVPEAGKKSVLLSSEAPCVPARNMRQFLELLLERGDRETASAILQNYVSCLGAKDVEPRRKTATGIGQLADVFAQTGSDVMAKTVTRLGEVLAKEPDQEVQSLLSAAFVRISAEASARRMYNAVSEVCSALTHISTERPVFADELRPRIGVENRLPEFIEEALTLQEVPYELFDVLRQTAQASAEQLADRFFRCMRREDCDRMVEIVQELGAPAMHHLRETLRVGQTRQAASVVGLLSRLDVPTLLELLPDRLPEWNRFYHDVVVRQIAYGAAPDRGRTLLELLEILDPAVLPQALDEIGMSGDHSAAASLMVIAESGEAQGRPPLLQLKAVESLGRLREPDSVPVLRGILEAKKMWKFVNHRELRIAAAQSLTKIDPRFGTEIMANSGLEPAELTIAPLDSAPACPWVRQRRYDRVTVAKPFSAILSSSWGKSSILVRELSLGGGMGIKEDNLRVGSDANLDISVGVRRIKAQVLLRRARVNEVGFEIVKTDLESRYRLRRMLIEAAEQSRGMVEEDEWSEQRKS